MLKIGLDIDNTICDFLGPYFDRFGIPKQDQDITKNVYQVLQKDKDFWLNLPIVNEPDFTPELYCTKRINSKRWTKLFLEKNNLPSAPIYQVYYQYGSKAPLIKGRVNVFVEDSISNFIDLNSKGIPCLLIDSQYNQSWGPIGRIYSLNQEEIIDTYHLFMHTIFPNFKDLLNGN